MIFETATLLFAGIVLCVAAWYDYKTSFVPDKLLYGFILVAVLSRILQGILVASWAPVWTGLAGLGIALVPAIALFYSGVWGAADSLLIIALGMLLGFPLFFTYVMLILIAVVLYPLYNLLGALFIKEWKATSTIKPSELLVGDHVVNDVKLAGIVFCKNDRLGITKKEIEHLRWLEQAGQLPSIEIKKGIPFVPIILVAFVIVLFL